MLENRSGVPPAAPSRAIRAGGGHPGGFLAAPHPRGLSHPCPCTPARVFSPLPRPAPLPRRIPSSSRHRTLRVLPPCATFFLLWSERQPYVREAPMRPKMDGILESSLY